MCELFLDREVHYPGQQIKGRVECLFVNEKTVKGVRVILEGNARVQFGLKNPIVKEEKCCSLQLNVAQDDVGLSGRRIYDFTFPLPKRLPATLTLNHGYIVYWLTAEVELMDEKNLSDKKRVLIGSYLDLNDYPICRNAMCRTAHKNMVLLLCRSPAITVEVKLPQGGYVPSQSILLSTKVENMSNVGVYEIRFKIIQVFQMVAQDYQQQHTRPVGEEVTVEESYIAPGTGKAFETLLNIPSDTPAPDLTNCNIIKMHCEILGRVVLPFPHRDLKIKVPFYLGNVPVKTNL